MPAALDQNYDGIIVGAGHHGLVLGCYLAEVRPQDPAGRPPPAIRRRAGHRGGDRAGLLPQPAFDQSFPHQRDAVVQGSDLGDRVEYITPRYEFGQPHLDGSALIFGRDLEETLANVARFSKKDAQTFRDWNRKAEEITAKIFLPERFSDPLPQAEREALLSKSDIGRDFLADDPAAAVRRGQGAVRERARAASVPVQDFAVRHLAGRHAVEDQPDGLGDPRLRSAKRLPALQGRLRQSRARAVRDLHRRGRALSRRRSSSTRSSSRAARRPASR